MIAVLAEYLPKFESHASIDNLFMYADAPGGPPDGSKPVKVRAWLQLANKELPRPLDVLGRLIEPYMEPPEEPHGAAVVTAGTDSDPRLELKRRLEAALRQRGLSYVQGGRVTDGSAAPSRSLREVILGRDLPAIEEEFDRALDNVQGEPREAVSAACNILESLFRVYIEDEGIEIPKKKDLQSLWKPVRAHLGFQPESLEDEDLKKILSGIVSIVDGVGAFRTHASSAHGRGRKIYRIKPRHARLAVNSAHTIVHFVLETWDERTIQRM